MTSRDALALSLAAIRDDCLPALVRLEDAIAGLSIDCVVGEERFRVVGAERLLVLDPIAEPAPTVLVRTTREAIVALIDGDVELLEAVRTGRLDLLADARTLLRLARAQRSFAEGAARARRVEAILTDYRAAISQSKAA